MKLSRSRFAGTRLSWVAVVVILGLVLATALALLLWRFGGHRYALEQGDPSEGEGAGPIELAFPSTGNGVGPAATMEKRPERAELKPDEVIDKQGFDCGMTRGKGAAADLAVVTVAEPLGIMDILTPFLERYSTRFSVLDQTGALHTGELPFIPYQRKLGKSPSGSVLAGFGGIALQPWLTPLPAEGEPLRIFAGDTMIYENKHVWLFDVANDGSSYFFIEPLGTDFSSRLVISNLEQGTEMHHDLGTMLSGPEGELAYLASYTAGGKEVHLWPVPSGVLKEDVGMHYFFKTEANSPPRPIAVPDRGLYDRAFFTSSEESFIFYEAASDDEKLQIVKARFDWSSGASTAIWSKEGPAGVKAGSVSITPDGAWLLFGTGQASKTKRGLRDSDRMMHLLDAKTGETRFRFFTDSFSAKARQLANVLPPQPTQDDVGLFNGAFFVGNNKLVLRHFPLEDGAAVETERFYDVFDLNSITVNAQPEYRVRGNEHIFNPCGSGGFPSTLGVTEDGRLVYTATLQ